MDGELYYGSEVAGVRFNSINSEIAKLMEENTWLTVIDWSGIGAMLQGIGTIIGAIAVIVAAKLGASTFENWRKQKLSERKIEQAERILTATYKVRRGLSYLRGPMMWPHELAAAEEKLKESGVWDSTPANDRQRITTAQGYYNRLNATLDDRRSLEECQPMARALFGEDLENAIETLNRQHHTVQVYTDAYARERGHRDAHLQNEINTTLFEGFPSDDGENQMDKTITELVKRIESICVPILRLEMKRGE